MSGVNVYTRIRKIVVKWVLVANSIGAPLLIVLMVWWPATAGFALGILWLLSVVLVLGVLAKEHGVPLYSPMFPSGGVANNPDVDPKSIDESHPNTM